MPTTPLILLGLRRNLAQKYIVSVSFLWHYFSAPPKHFWQKNYLKFSLQFPARDTQLLGWGYSNRSRDSRDLRQHV
jgi:hypothetical protein